MRIAIIGGLGFLGGRIGARLVEEGHEVVLCTRRDAEPAPWMGEAEVRRINWEVISSLEFACRGADVVVHAAGLDAQRCLSDPALAFRVNGRHVQWMVEAAADNGVKRFIHFSTAHVYASPLEGHITEDSPLTNSHPYATSHAAAERFLREQSHRIESVSLRLANAFGVPSYAAVPCWGLVVNDLCRQVVEQGHMHLHNAHVRRDFIALSQVMSDVTTLLGTGDWASLGGVLNLGSGASATVDDMARLVQGRATEVLGFTPSIESQPVTQTGVTSLDYATTRPFQRPSNPQSSWEHEVEALLLFCREHFPRHSGDPIGA